MFALLNYFGVLRAQHCWLLGVNNFVKERREILFKTTSTKSNPYVTLQQ